MSTTIIILSNAYEDYINKKRKRKNFNGTSNKESSQQKSKFIKSNVILFSILFILIISTIIFTFSILRNWSSVIVIPSFLGYIISMILLIVTSEKDDIKNYRKRRKNYYRNLKGFMNILRYEFELYSKEEIEFMIKECDETSKQFSYDNNLVKKSLDSWKKFIFPIITFGGGFLVKSDTVMKSVSWNMVTIGVVSAILILAMIAGVLYAIQQVIDPMINSYRNRINRLKQVLTDIYLKYYV